MSTVSEVPCLLGGVGLFNATISVKGDSKTAEAGSDAAAGNPARLCVNEVQTRHPGDRVIALLQRSGRSNSEQGSGARTCMVGYYGK